MLKKYTSDEMKKAVLGVIEEKLSHMSAFSSNSVCYYGVQLEYDIKLTLHSRGEEQVTLKQAAIVGDLPVTGTVGMPIPKVTVETGSGKHFAGKSRFDKAIPPKANAG